MEFSDFELETCRQVIKNLLDYRVFISIQMIYGRGGMEKFEFDEYTRDYFDLHTSVKDPRLVDKIKFLFSLLDDYFDSETISMVLNCTIEDAERAMIEVKE